MTLCTADPSSVEVLESSLAAMGGCYGPYMPLRDDPRWNATQHSVSGKWILIRQIPGGASIINDEDGAFHWTGHTLTKGLREADVFLCQHNRRR